MHTEEPAPGQHRPDEALQLRIVAMRDEGASWKEIQDSSGLTRQQARYAYQLGRRSERRRKRLDPD